MHGLPFAIVNQASDVRGDSVRISELMSLMLLLVFEDDRQPTVDIGDVFQMLANRVGK